MVKFFSQLPVGALLLHHLASAMALPTDQSHLDKRTVGKRLLLWDYTCTDNPAVAPKIQTVPFGNGLMQAVVNWNTWYPPELNGHGLFEPMVRTPAQLGGSDWTNLISAITTRGSSIVHFYNEPDMNGVSAADAAAAWHNNMVPLRNKYHVRLVSPAVASNDAGKAWLADFMSRIQDAPPDFLGLHYYGTVAGDAESYMTSMHSAHPYPVIVSEVASISRDQGQVNQFTADLTNWMDATGWIQRYGWFGAMPSVPDSFVSPEAMLMNSDGSFKDLMYKIMYDHPIKV